MTKIQKFRLVAYFPNRRPLNGEDEKYVVDQQLSKDDLCGYHDLSSCRFVIEKDRNGEYIPVEIITHSKKYSDQRIIEELEKFPCDCRIYYQGSPVEKLVLCYRCKRIKELKEVNNNG